jgi:hypothetical protein
VANDKYGITDDVDGKLCEYRDYARLKAEVERLEKTEEYLQNTLNQYALDDMRLQAKVERLTKAGDLMLKYASANMPYPPYVTIAKDWLAAKEGKGQS